MPANAQTDISDTGQMVASVGRQGTDDFASLLESGGGGQQQQTEQRVSVDETVTPENGSVVKKTLPQQGAADNTQQRQTQQTQQQVVVPAKPAGVDPELLEQIVASAVRGTQAAQQQSRAEPEKALSAQEFNAKYGIPEINETTVAAILDADPKKAAVALQQLLMANLRAGVLMGRDLSEASIAKTRTEFEPHVRSWKEHQAAQADRAAEDRFFTTHKDLAGERDLVLDTILPKFKALVADGSIKFRDEAHAFQQVADATRKLTARMNKQGAAATQSGQQSQQSQQSQSQQQQGTGGRQMAAASTTGQGGTGAGSAKSDEEAIFGSDWR